MSPRLRSIDALRGIAALAVAFGHALIAAPYLDVGGDWFTRSILFIKWISATGVPLFFVISGFCIHLAQARHEGTRAFDFVAFWRRRLWRLYPTYAVVLGMCLVMLWAMLVAGAGEEILAPYPEPRAQWIALDGLVHAVMLHGLHPWFDQAAFNPPFWTLAREEYLYLMYPLLLVARRRWPWPIVAAALGALSVALELVAPRITPTPGWSAIVATSAPALWVQWCLGAVAADAYLGVVALPRWCAQARWVPVLLLIAYVAPFSTLWLAVAYFVAVNACVRREREGAWPSMGLLAWLPRAGVWSYSLYLVHHPVQTIALAAALRIMPDVSMTGFVIRAIGLTILSCVAARALFSMVEHRFLTPVAPPQAPRLSVSGLAG